MGEFTNREIKSVPLCGDALDDIFANAMVNALRIYYSEKEFEERRNKPISIIPIRENDGDIYLGTLKLELSPRLRALYILFLRHPKGVALKAIENDYLTELNQLYNKFREGNSTKGVKKGDIPYNLKAIPKNKCLINGQITKLEKENGGINLSSCKIYCGESQPYTILSAYRETIPSVEITEL